MRQLWCVRVSTGMSLVLLFMCATGCEGSLYGWRVRTNSTLVGASFYQVPVDEKPVAIFPALSMRSLRGTEVGMSAILGDILSKLIPNWKVIGEQATLTGINTQGLGAEYIRMRADAEPSHLLDRDALRKIGKALGVRYIFQPRLATFTQAMTDRARFPGFNIRLMQTRSSTVRMSLQLWDVESGELMWSSVAEAALESEAISQDPVFLEDAVRLTFGSLMADFLNRRTSSKYTPLNKVLSALVQAAVPTEGKDEENGGEAKEEH
ncbi:hypothetical protein [Nitrospira lenta]|uniref:hypothetical protein n=1 Tax=Nitrospira lenta TaxID=1436998 RepID=UPI0011B5E418|nr:hypothetical protein [Nitrospira lenta]